MGPETTAALVGAGVGGAIGYLATAATTRASHRRARKVAAELIFAELTLGYSSARTALLEGRWSSRSGGPEQSAWQNHGGSLLPGSSIDTVATLAQAYGSLENVAWLTSGSSRPFADREMRDSLLERTEDGLLVVGKIIGKSEAEIRASLDTVKSADQQFEAVLREIGPPPREHDEIAG